MAVAVTDDSTIRAANTNSKYEKGSFDNDPELPVNTAKHSWINYIHCGYKVRFSFSQRCHLSQFGLGGRSADLASACQGIFEHMGDKLDFSGRPKKQNTALAQLKERGLQLFFDGAVPQGSGLSSSSALVVASAIATMHALGLSLSQQEVSKLTCTCERHIGTLSGGMDQAISVMGEAGVAKHVQFNPVRATSVELPPGCTFVIANTIVESLKSVSADGKYNLRVLECTMAAIILGKKFNTLPSYDPNNEIITLKQVASMGRDEPDILTATENVLHKEPYTRAQVESVVGKSLEETFGFSLSSNVENNPLRKAIAFGDSHIGYELRKRAMHVYSEASRVKQFAKLCMDTSKTSEEKIESIGALMTASHNSCRDRYDCSSPELDELVSLSLKYGAVGARLTGAGWGGCIVACVKDADVDKFIEHLYEAYYNPRLERGLITHEQLKHCIFPSKPSNGAYIVTTD